MRVEVPEELVGAVDEVDQHGLPGVTIDRVDSGPRFDRSAPLALHGRRAAYRDTSAKRPRGRPPGVRHGGVDVTRRGRSRRRWSHGRGSGLPRTAPSRGRVAHRLRDGRERRP